MPEFSSLVLELEEVSDSVGVVGMSDVPSLLDGGVTSVPVLGTVGFPLLSLGRDVPSLADVDGLGLGFVCYVEGKLVPSGTRSSAKTLAALLTKRALDSKVVTSLTFFTLCTPLFFIWTGDGIPVL